MSAPQVLVVTSSGASPAAVVPVLAALDAAGLAVRAIDAGRVGARVDGAFERVVRAIVGEVAERRLLREMSANPPDVVVAFDPGTTTALTVARDEARRAAPVIAVVGELDPDAAWASAGADRYLVIDDEAAVALSDQGIEGERVISVGALCGRGFVNAAGQSRARLRKRFKIAADRPVVVVQVDGLGYEMCGQLALQLSLTGVDATYLFDAGTDQEAATALRRQVPVLDLRAKLFGRTADAPLLWRCADLAVARPRPHAVAQALVLGLRFVSFLPDNKADKRAALALEQRGVGASAANALLISSAIEALINRGSKRSARLGADGAANVADIAWVVAKVRRDVLEERRAGEVDDTRERVRAATRAAAAAARTSAVAGDLEDLGGAGQGAASSVADVPRSEDVTRLRAEVATRVKQVSKTVFEAREAAEQWDRKRQEANAAGDATKERANERNADRERARMHAALAELSELQAELKGLESAAAAAAAAPRVRETPSSARRSGPRRAPKKTIDDMLSELKQQQSGGTSVHTKSQPGRGKKKRKPKDVDPIDDELAALKRKMAAAKKRRGK